MNATAEIPFATDVWQRLSDTDVSDHNRQIFPKEGSNRPIINYLPWDRAWLLVKRIFPGTTWRRTALNYHNDGTAEVEVTVYITNCTAGQHSDPLEVVVTHATLPVMDHWFNPIKNPTATDFNKSERRALVKALAYAGLGLDLWGDDNIPVGKLEDPITKKQRDILMELVAETGTEIDYFYEWAGIETMSDLPAEKFKSARGLLESKRSKS